MVVDEVVGGQLTIYGRGGGSGGGCGSPCWWLVVLGIDTVRGTYQGTCKGGKGQPDCKGLPQVTSNWGHGTCSEGPVTGGIDTSNTEYERITATTCAWRAPANQRLTLRGGAPVLPDPFRMAIAINMSPLLVPDPVLFGTFLYKVEKSPPA